MSTETTTPPADGEQNTPRADTDKGTYTPPATQADLDQIVEKRLARERAKFADYDEVKAKATKFDEHEAANKPPEQKAIDDARSAGETEAESKFLAKLVRRDVLAAATAAGFLDPEDALSVVGDELPVKDGDADTEEIARRIKELSEKKPYLVGFTEPTPKPRTRPKPGQGVAADDKPGNGRAAAALRQLGRARKSA